MGLVRRWTIQELDTPFVDEDHFVHKYFLPQQYAIIVPTFAGVTLVCFLTVFVGVVMLKGRNRKSHMN
ncbi:hypothetical protein L7F22_009120 [Adiantum nelumboides]|nr:hypothetical protein [Adiantum nelumboides]